MKILVVGAAGQVGRELVLRSGNRKLIGLDRRSLDITDRDAIAEALRHHRVSIVINAAGYTAVDRAEREPAQAFAINYEAVVALARTTAHAGIPLLHLSTDYVFDGTQSEPYEPGDKPSPLSVYGHSKWAGERAIRLLNPLHMILRVSWVFGAHGNNFVKTILRLARERSELDVIADQHGAPTHAGAIADVLLSLADRHLHADHDASLPWGTYHYTGKPLTTWHGFAQATVKQAVERGLLEQAPLIRPIRTQDYPLPARRPRNSALDTRMTLALLGLEPRPWHEGLGEVLDHWHSNSNSNSN
jgi:dTDP-4-dehydrorhamnose reductase